MMRKRFLFYIILVALTYLGMEAISYGAYFVKHGAPFTFAKIQTQHDTSLGSAKVTDEKGNFRVEDGIGTRIVHPFVGFVIDPSTKLRNITVDPIEQFPEGQCTVNPHGFVGNPAFPVRKPSTITIVIVGGSVSNQFNCTMRDRLIAALKQSPAYKDKDISVIGLGVGAHHQPQQLMALNYYLSQGGQYDILLNIDGANEAFVPAVMAQNNIYPSYPLFWKQFISSFDNKEIRLIGAITFYQDVKQRLARVLDIAPYSITVNVVWSMLDKITDGRIQQARIAMNAAAVDKVNGKSFYWAGPNEEIKDLTEFSVNLWLNSSIQLAKISKANDATYLHFLQPNIHVRDSKEFSEKERNIIENLPSYIPPDTTDLITRTYKIMGSKGSIITNAGGHFYDLSPLFKNEKGTVYIDGAGHLTKLGNEILADFMAEQIMKGWKIGI